MNLSGVPFSILDLCPIREGGTAADAFRDSLDLARHAERWGYLRYWIAEHHGIPGVASAATAVVLAHVAAGTRTIRVGSGGIMLPNHAPLIIAEQFGTLASLFPGRIDLGLGRAPGGDTATARALRRYLSGGAESFPQDVQELMEYFAPGGPGGGVHAIPGEGLDVPVWILGSSDFGARLAADLGLPFAFASHFAPGYLHEALALYRDLYQPSERWPRPHVMVGINMVAADSDAEALRLFTSLQQAFLNMVRGTPAKLPPPVDDMDSLWSAGERAAVARMMRYAVVGGVEGVRKRLQGILEETGADEIILSAPIFEHAARLRSCELALAARV